MHASTGNRASCRAAVGRYLRGAEELLNQALGHTDALGGPHGPLPEFEVQRGRKVRIYYTYEEAAAVGAGRPARRGPARVRCPISATG